MTKHAGARLSDRLEPMLAVDEVALRVEGDAADPVTEATAGERSGECPNMPPRRIANVGVTQAEHEAGDGRVDVHPEVDAIGTVHPVRREDPDGVLEFGAQGVQPAVEREASLVDDGIARDDDRVEQLRDLDRRGRLGEVLGDLRETLSEKRPHLGHVAIGDGQDVPLVRGREAGDRGARRNVDAPLVDRGVEGADAPDRNLADAAVDDA
ncbi:MAG: hypothetical protein RID81_00450 [Sandaracinaceae bacterium]